MAQERPGAFNVVALFRDDSAARAAMEALKRSGVPSSDISLQTRRMTDDQPDRPAAPVAEPSSRPRDVQVSGRVFKDAGMSMAVGTLIGGLVGFGVGLAIFGLGTVGMWISMIVGAVMGSVVGGIQGGIFGAMTEAEKEQGVLVGVHAATREEIDRAASTLRGLSPERIDYYDESGGLPRG